MPIIIFILVFVIARWAIFKLDDAWDRSVLKKKEWQEYLKEFGKFYSSRRECREAFLWDYNWFCKFERRR